MPFTYTYTARNKDNPNRLVTFTIVENHLKVNLTGLIEQVSEAFGEKDRKTAMKDIISTQSGTGLYKAIERLSGPVHIKDVTPNYKDGQLTVIFWYRVANLRFAPIVVVMGEVDNPDAAAQFITTLKQQQDHKAKPGIFAGPLDYWITWIAMIIGLIVLFRWPREKKAIQKTE
jgi:hypothetical protein